MIDNISIFWKNYPLNGNILDHVKSNLLIINILRFWHAVGYIPNKSNNSLKLLKTNKMKNLTKLFATAAIIIAASNVSFAQATATAAASATIITPITITKTVDMNFGNVAVSATIAGTAILAPAGTRTTGGAGGVTLPATTGTVAAATFTVSGQASYTYAITLPTTATITSSGNTMTVNAFTSSPSATGLLSSGGTQTLTVGATLNVAAAQAAGTYTNASGVPVTVNYN